MTVFELATRVPLLVAAPWLQSSHGQTTQAIVELVDIMPTVAELVNVPLPEREPVPLDGTSFAAVVGAQNASALPATVVKEYALSQHARCWKDTHPGKCGTTLAFIVEGSKSSSLPPPPPPSSSRSTSVGGDGPHDIANMCDCHFIEAADIDFMGLSIRVPEWRYTHWYAWNGTALRVDWNASVATELYAHHGDMGNDFDSFENVNVVSDAVNRDVVHSLQIQLERAFGRQQE